MQLTELRVGMSLALLLLTVSLGLSSACSSKVPATVTLSAPFMKNRPIYVTLSAAFTGRPADATAAQQRESIVASLSNAGLHPTNVPAEANYDLLVRLGKARSRSDCGILHNVIYILTADGREIAIIKARGKTSGCTPNVFEDMSARLASIASE